MNKINNTQVDDPRYIDVVISMYDLIERSDNCSKTSGTLWQYCRDELVLDGNSEVDFTADNADTNLFKKKRKNNKLNKQQWHKKC